MKFSAQIIFFILFSVFCFLFSVVPVSAQTSYQTPNTNPDVPKNLHTYSQNVLLEVSSAVICQLIGIDVVNHNNACLGIDSQTGKIGYVTNSTGLIGVMSNMIAVLYTPPAHVADYTRYLAGNFGIAKKAYAQEKGGYGFGGLQPIFTVWNTFKNVVYLMFVIVFVLVGFAIMLRVKIDPRTVMTIENQIPKLIIGILLTTFSFAIAGLLIDLMWVFTYLSINVLTSASTNVDPSVATRNVLTPPIGFVNQMFDKSFYPGGILTIATKSGLGVQAVLDEMFNPTSLDQIFKWPKDSGCNGFLPTCWIKDWLGGTVAEIVSKIVGWTLSWVVGILAILIIIVALIFALFRIWFQLLTAYIYVLIDIVLAPFFIAGSMIPGSPIGFGTWMRDMLANLLAFPVTVVLFLMGRIFMDVFGTTANSSLQVGKIFVPPLIGNPNDANALGALIGLGFVLITPQVVTMMKELLHAPQFKYTAAIGQAIGTGPGMIGSALHSLTPYSGLAAFAKLTHGKFTPGLNTILGATGSGTKGIRDSVGQSVSGANPQATPNQPGQHKP